jgi:NDP-sugar pyrophosphorylase family protein
VKAVVLVGGEGTRLRPLTYTTPKQLLPVAEVAMLERVLAQLRDNGVDEAVLSLGYRPDAFLAAYPDGVAAGVRLSYAVEPEPLDTAGAVRFAARTAQIGEMFLVVNGDVLTDLDIGALVALHRRTGALATIALTPVEDPSRFGVVPTDERGRVVAFVEKPPPGEAPTDKINAGTYVLEPAVLDRIPDGRRVSIERETFPALVAEHAVYALSSDAYWLDTGTPSAYLQANFDLVAGRRTTDPAPGATAIGAGLWVIGSPALAGELVGPCLVGREAVVEAGAVVERSVIGAGSVVRAGARVTGSVLLPGVEVCADAAVEGSIVGHGSRIGDGAVVAPLSVIGDRAVVERGAHLADARVPAAR